MKNTVSTLSCSKLLAHSPMMMPSRPKIIDTDTTQNRNAARNDMCRAEGQPISRMPTRGHDVRSTTTARLPAIIST